MRCKHCKEDLVFILGKGYYHQDGNIEHQPSCDCKEEEHVRKYPKIHRSHYAQPIP
jgi:hypothetical protein